MCLTKYLVLWQCPSFTISLEDAALTVSQEDGTDLPREDSHCGPVVRHHLCAAFTTRQHYNSLSVPGHDDVAIRAKHCARTVCGFDDIMVLPSFDTADIALPIDQHHGALGVPGRDDVSSRVHHHARTVCGFGDIVAPLVNSEDIAITLPVGQHNVTLLSSASPSTMMLPFWSPAPHLNRPRLRR